jgi:hypothetical protein
MAKNPIQTFLDAIHTAGGEFTIFSSKLKSTDTKYTHDRANIVRITCVAWLVTIALTWAAYIHDLRIFKLSPVIDILEATPVWFDRGLFVLNIGFLICLIKKPLQPILAFGALACAVFWVLQDLMRFQPYIYMYFATILMAVFFKSDGLNALKIMIASVYFWAGFHKLNLTFYSTVFPWFIAQFYKFSELPSVFNSIICSVILIVPLFEAAIGLLLFFLATGALLRLWLLLCSSSYSLVLVQPAIGGI